MGAWRSTCLQARSRVDTNHSRSEPEKEILNPDENPEVQCDYTCVNALTIMIMYYLNKSTGSAMVVQQMGASDQVTRCGA